MTCQAVNESSGLAFVEHRRLSPRPAARQPPALDGARQQLRQPERRRPRPRAFAERLPGNRGVRQPEVPKAEQLVQAHEDRRVQHGRDKKHHKPRRRLGDDELRAETPARNPTMVLASPPMPMTPVESASWRGRRRSRPAARSPAPTQARRTPPRPARDRRRRCPGEEPAQRGLQRQRDDCRQRPPRRPSPALLLRRSRGRRRRQDDQHLLEAGEIHRRPDQDCRYAPPALLDGRPPAR